MASPAEEEISSSTYYYPVHKESSIGRLIRINLEIRRKLEMLPVSREGSLSKSGPREC